MERFLKYLESQELARINSDCGVVTLDDSSNEKLHFVVNPTKLTVNVTAKEHAASLVIVSSGSETQVDISINDGAKLHLLEVLCQDVDERITISQSRDSRLSATVLELGTSTSNIIVNLDGRGADSEVNMLQLPSGKEHLNLSLRIAHNSADCTSRSTAKCAASGSSIGEFHGLVYVAKDAQRTASQQNSRNIALSQTAKIIAEPQLEIYADDVKCSHGATVGQMNKDAILYMRQRGLSEEQARKVQLDGFVSDITNSCAIESLQEPLSEMVREHLHNM